MKIARVLYFPFDSPVKWITASDLSLAKVSETEMPNSKNDPSPVTTDKHFHLVQ